MIRHFDSDGVGIAYRIWGVGDPVLLIHGFASNHRVNWVDTGWVKHLAGEGRRVIAIDNRGHGESEKLYRPELYGAPEMAEDARRLLDHLSIGRADVIGYSMGARITAFLAMAHRARVRSAVLGGLAEALIKGVGAAEPIAAALEAPSAALLRDRRQVSHRRFAEMTGSDLRALAACIRGARRRISEDEVATISCPVLVAAGSDDAIAGSPEALARLIRDGDAFVIEGKDHMTSVGARPFKQAVSAFLARRP
jgi:pimeloyl-ACP methyl ester carboxylesterase